MCIEAREKLTTEQERVVTLYFNNYEYATSINKYMRGKGGIDERYAHVVAKESMIIREAVEQKGIELDRDIAVYRAMSQAFDNSENAIALSRRVPAGAPTTCMISAASTPGAANFGGSAYVYHIVVPRGERCLRRLTKNIGVGEWYEYLFAPADIVFYGNYENVPSSAIPVVYNKLSTGLSSADYERLLRMVGMRDFSAPVASTASASSTSSALSTSPDRPLPVKHLVAPSGEKIPVLLNASDNGRLMIFPWGIEQTFGDQTVRIFDMRRGATLLE